MYLHIFSFIYFLSLICYINYVYLLSYYVLLIYYINIINNSFYLPSINMNINVRVLTDFACMNGQINKLKKTFINMM